MSYVVPSVLVYQQLENAGGVANSTPDLQACVIGPAYNVLRYVAGSTVSLIKTAATSAASAKGDITAGSNRLSFAVIPPFTIGDTVLVPGADTSGGTLAAKVVDAAGAVLTLDTNAGATVSQVDVRKQGVLTNSNISNAFDLPSQKPGQVIDTASIQVFANQARVETLSTGFTGYAGNNALVYSAAAGTANATAGSAVIANVTNPTLYREGDTVSLAGAGAGGVTFVAKILTISGNNFTLSATVPTTVGNAVMAKAAISNVSTATSTLLVETGDEAAIEYTDINGTNRVLSTTVIKVAAVNGTLTNISIADVLPADVARSTTAVGALSVNAVGFTLANSTGFAAGDTIVIRGAGVGGSDLETVIGGLSGATVSSLSPAVATAVPAGAVVVRRARVTFKSRKVFNNQAVPVAKPVSGGANFDPSNTATTGVLTLNPGLEIVYGRIVSANIHVAYRALRTDLSGSILSIASPDDNMGVFGDVSEDNPLALGVSVALANTTTEVRAIAVKSNDAQGYASARELAEGERVYGLAPLTQDASILQAFSLHAQQMSTPEEAMWRVVLGNTKIPTRVPVGTYTADIVNANGGNNTISLQAGKYVLTSSNSTFISDNVTPGDTLNITAGTGTPSPIGAMQVLEVVSNQQLVVQASGIATGISFYITRTLSKTQRAAAVAAASKSFGSNRFIHIQPDTVVVNVGGRNVVLPGYYLCCAVAGLIAGFPSQQGFTNIGIAGITDLSNSNFTFTRAQLNTMAESGTFLFVQETSGGIPYVRHELTTDMTVYEYRELQAVKNWDFLSYFYRDKLSGFIGKWNITPDTLGTIRSTVNASSELLKSKKLPKIGAPLIDAKIEKLAQNENNKDQVDVRLKIQQPSVLNYLNMYLVI